MSSDDVSDIDDVEQDYEYREDNDINEYLDKKLIYKLINENLQSRDPNSNILQREVEDEVIHKYLDI